MAAELSVVEFEAVREASVKGTPVIVDVREVHEYTAGHVPKSVNIPLGELGSALQLDPDQFKEKYKVELPSKESAVIVKCKVGGRAGRGAALMKDLGFTDVLLYKGSFTDWTAKGGTVEKIEA